MAIHSGGQTVFSPSHIEGITLCAGEEVDEVAGGARIQINAKKTKIMTKSDELIIQIRDDKIKYVKECIFIPNGI